MAYNKHVDLLFIERLLPPMTAKSVIVKNLMGKEKKQ